MVLYLLLVYKVLFWAQNTTRYMEAKFSHRTKEVISYSREEALRLGNDFIGVEHLLLGLIREGEGKAITILKEFNLDLMHIRKELEKGLIKSKVSFQEASANIPLVKQAEKVLKIMRKYKFTKINDRFTKIDLKTLLD